MLDEIFPLMYYHGATERSKEAEVGVHTLVTKVWRFAIQSRMRGAVVYVCHENRCRSPELGWHLRLKESRPQHAPKAVDHLFSHAVGALLVCV